MSHSSKSAFLEDNLAFLVQHFGAERVRVALAKLSPRNDEAQQKSPRALFRQKPSRPSVVNSLELIRMSHPEKHQLLTEFLSHLKNRTVLPEAQDIRHFAQIIGLKEIKAKSRKDMIPTLMRFLLEQPNERLLIDLQRAGNISEQQRQQGFSVLTDKLLGEKDARY